MTFNVVGRSQEECRLLETTVAMGLNKRFKQFLANDYGHAVENIVAALSCYPAGRYNFPSNRLDSRSRTLYVNVDLSYDLMSSSSVNVRRDHVLERLRIKLPAAVAKYKSAQFDAQRFGSDFVAWIDAFPPLPNENEIPSVSRPYDEVLSGYIDDLLSMVMEEFGETAAMFNLKPQGELRGDDQQGIRFESEDDERAVTIFASKAETSVVLMAESRRAGRLFLPRLRIELAGKAPGDRVPVKRHFGDPLSPKQVGTIVLPEPGDLRSGLRALSQFAKDHPTLLFPGGKGMSTE